MQRNLHNPALQRGRPLDRAREKTGDVQRELAVAGAELELTNAVLGRQLPEESKRSQDVKRALSQNEVIEDKVQEAADELQAVSELLDEEVAERERLERELASRPPS